MPGLFRAVVTQAKQENEGTRAVLCSKNSVMLSSVTRETRGIMLKIMLTGGIVTYSVCSMEERNVLIEITPNLYKMCGDCAVC